MTLSPDTTTTSAPLPTEATFADRMLAGARMARERAEYKTRCHHPVEAGDWAAVADLLTVYADFQDRYAPEERTAFGRTRAVLALADRLLELP